MKTRPKDIGTAAETAVLHVLQNYWPHAHRNVLFGAVDQGDIGGCGPFVWEVKGGHQGWDSAPGDVEAWLLEARREAAAAGRAFGILVVQRKGYSTTRAARWYVWVPIETLTRLLGSGYSPLMTWAVRLELGDFLEMIADLGHVDPSAH